MVQVQDWAFNRKAETNDCMQTHLPLSLGSPVGKLRVEVIKMMVVMDMVSSHWAAKKPTEETPGWGWGYLNSNTWWSSAATRRERVMWDGMLNALDSVHSGVHQRGKFQQKL